MLEMTPKLQPKQPTGLNYYPLAKTGERFPFADPAKKPRLEPRPDSDIDFFQGMLEGIAEIEKKSYELLVKLGAAKPESVRTAGGGNTNPAWMEIRKNLLNIPVTKPQYTEAAYGVAMLGRLRNHY